ncbi:Fanconi anemia core complex-associated protein 24-like isoform X2 [Haliotis rubra]|uniref:Fanconi anemia core complex-associated protein 24-like isoform X2 n=1 Tax=Haliotis rubra TaxID=36100 RepID=UPI001EE56F00|nr:Fanconi anemia core complex-associated protein 24-like isoform X2 [Haliotis rubra]
MDLSQCTQAIVQGLSEIRVPLGHILVSGRWRNTDLVNTLQGTANVHFDDGLGVVDFHPSSHTGVIYVSEADIVSGSGYKRKVAKLRKANKVRGVVMAEKTATSGQYYQDLQKFVMLEIGFVLLPVNNQKEAAGLLAQMVDVESKPEANPFFKKPRPVSVDVALLSSLQCIPRLGGVKAKQLLLHFGSLQAIARASLEDLSSIVGKASATNIKAFLDGS